MDRMPAKKAIIAEIEAYELTGDAQKDAEARQAFAERFAAIGFVPFKEKDKISQAYRQALDKFPGMGPRGPRQGGGNAPRGEVILYLNEIS